MKQINLGALFSGAASQGAPARAADRRPPAPSHRDAQARQAGRRARAPVQKQALKQSLNQNTNQNRTQEQKPEQKKRGFFARFGRIDVPLLMLMVVLLLFGLVMLFSASYPTGHMRYGDSFAFITPQLKFAGLGALALIAMTFFDYHHLRKLAWPFMGVTLVLLVVVLFMEEKNGAKRWIWLNASHTQSIQPSEFAKFAVILLFAAILAANQRNIKKFSYGFVPFITIMGAVSVLLLQEPHLSCTILVLGIGFIMMIAGGTPLLWIGLTGATAGGALVLALKALPDLVPYLMERISPWLNPMSVDSTQSHQILQSLIAVGSGGLMGRGIGNSVQKFLYLPEMYNDYIFAIICEELGFIGAMLVIVLFMLFLLRGVVVAMRAKDRFGAMLVVGICVQIGLQAMLHIAVNTNAIPCTGISLPFFSSGGSSLVMLMGEIGIVLSVSRQGARSGLSYRTEDGDGSGEAQQMQEADADETYAAAAGG